MADGSPPPGWVSVNREASFVLANDLLLTPSERLLLYDLLLLVDYKFREWPGSLSDLSSWTRLDWKTVKASIERLDQLGVIEIVVPFGRNGKGRVRVLLYDELVVPNLTRRKATPLPSSLLSVPVAAKPQVRGSDTSGNTEQGADRRRTGTEDGAKCVTCGAPADGISGPGGVPYCREHEPML